MQCPCVQIILLLHANIACGNVIGLADLDQCFRYTGVKRECNLSGQEYEFFEMNFGERVR